MYSHRRCLERPGRVLLTASALVLVLAAAAPCQETDAGRLEGEPPTQSQGDLGVDRYDLIGEPAGRPLSGDELDAATLELSRLLRCPVCQGLSVADSPSASALAMRNEVRELLSRGYTPDQIADYFESTYGEFVRLQPRFRGLNWLVWLAPVVALLLGLALVLRAGRRRSGERESEEEPELDEWRDKVRQEIGS